VEGGHPDLDPGPDRGANARGLQGSAAALLRKTRNVILTGESGQGGSRAYNGRRVGISPTLGPAISLLHLFAAQRLAGRVFNSAPRRRPAAWPPSSSDSPPAGRYFVRGKTHGRSTHYPRGGRPITEVGSSPGVRRRLAGEKLMIRPTVDGRIAGRVRFLRCSHDVPTVFKEVVRFQVRPV